MASERELMQLVADVELFRDLSKGQLKRLVQASRETTHPEGKELATQGLGAMAFHLILEGKASVSKDGQVLRTLGPGDSFGEISMIDGRARSATVTAVEPITALAIPHVGFEKVLDEDPDFARQLLKTLCARLREAESRSPAV